MTPFPCILSPTDKSGALTKYPDQLPSSSVAAGGAAGFSLAQPKNIMKIEKQERNEKKARVMAASNGF
jgi:hypothetical protein